MDLEVALLNEGVRPDTPAQFFFAHNVPGAIHQECQDLKHTCAEVNRLIGFQL